MKKNLKYNSEKFKSKAENLIEEYIKCKNNFEYFLRNYILLELVGGTVHIKPYKKQIELIESLQKNKFIIILKSRQLGVSSIIQCYICWLVVFYENVGVGIVSKDAPEATSFSRKIIAMIENLPPWFNIKFTKRAEQSFILNTGSQCYATPVTKVPSKTLRGKSITFLILDEAAFTENIDEAWTSMVPTLSTNQMMAKKSGTPYGTVILSTPNKTVGVGAFFYLRYLSALSGTDILKPFIIHWKDVEELASDPDWYDTQCKLFGHDQRKIKQELEMVFLPSEGSFFDEKTNLSLQQTNNIPEKISKIFGGEIWKFKDPEPQKYYMIGVDTAPEFGSDKSAITIFDYETLEQVWEYQTKCEVRDFIKVVKFACSTYNNGIVVIENNSYGNQVMEELNNSEFSTMMYKEKRGKDQIVPGISTNSKTRPLMIDALYTYVSEYPQCIKSKRLAMELIGLVEKSNGRVEADIGGKDDLALSSAFCYYVRKYDPPLMIETSKLHNSEFNTIMQYNDYEITMENSSLLKLAKQQIEENQYKDNNMFIDIFSLYNSR